MPERLIHSVRFAWEEIPLSLDVLDALVEQYLSGPVHGWAEFEREQTSLGTVRYSLRQWQLGDLGVIVLRKRGDHVSAMEVRYPARPGTVFTEEQRQRYAASSDKEEQRRIVSETAREVRDESARQYQRRRDHQTNVLDYLFAKIEQDPAWQRLAASPPTPLDKSHKTAVRGGGRPQLTHDELLYRLAKAQQAEELHRDNPELYWKEIAGKIGWRIGTSEAAVALLRDARCRLKRLESGDPILTEIAELRARETKET